MSRAVLRELDDLRRLLDEPVGLPYASTSSREATKHSRPVQHGVHQTYDNGSPRGTPHTLSLHATETSVDRLGRAIEAAEEEMEAALRRTTDVHRSQLRQRECEVAELQRVVAAKDRAIDGLRETLGGMQRAYEGRLAGAESALAGQEAEVGALQAELMALRTNKEDLEVRLQQAVAATAKAEQDGRSKDAELEAAAKSAAEEQAKALQLLQRERKDKELARLECAELQRELDAALEEIRVMQRSESELSEGLQSMSEQLQRSQQELQATAERLRAESERSQQLQVQLSKVQLELELMGKTKDSEVGALRSKLKTERTVRKTCEKWLRAEVKSREEMEWIISALHDSDVPRPHQESTPKVAASTAGGMQSVEQLIQSMCIPDNGGDHVLHSANYDKFNMVKNRLQQDSDMLRQQVIAAKRMLHERLPAGLA